MCKEETMLRMTAIEEELLEILEAEVECGLGNVDACEMGEVVDMLKDFEEAKYYFSIVKAMHEDDGKMGYKPMRTEEHRMAHDDTAHDRYMKAKEAYHRTMSSESRRAMKEAANDYMREFTEAMGEMWRETDQDHRNQMHSALVKFVNELV